MDFEVRASDRCLCGQSFGVQREGPFRIAGLEEAGLGDGDTALFQRGVVLEQDIHLCVRTLGSGLPDRIGKPTKSLMEALVDSGEKHRRARRLRSRKRANKT